MPLAARAPSACSVGGANPPSRTSASAPTDRPVSVCSRMPCATWCSRTVGLGSPTGRSTRNDDTRLPERRRPSWARRPRRARTAAPSPAPTTTPTTGSPRESSQLRSAPGDHGEHHVVDVAAVRGPDAAVVVQLGAGDREPALGRRCRRSAGVPGARRLAVRAIENSLPGRADDLARPWPPRRPVADRTLSTTSPGRATASPSASNTSAAVRRLRARHPQLLRHVPRLGGDVQDDLSDVDGADAVDHRLVGLGEDGDPALLGPALLARSGRAPRRGTSPRAGGCGRAGATSGARRAR